MTFDKIFLVCSSGKKVGIDEDSLEKMISSRPSLKKNVEDSIQMSVAGAKTLNIFTNLPYYKLKAPTIIIPDYDPLPSICERTPLTRCWTNWSWLCDGRDANYCC